MPKRMLDSNTPEICRETPKKSERKTNFSPERPGVMLFSVAITLVAFVETIVLVIAAC